MRSFPITGYSVDPTGQRVVCSALDSDGRSHLWIVPIDPQSVSADGKWVITQIALPGKEALRGVVAFPIRGGSPIRLCRGLCFVSWRRDAKFMYVHLPGTSQQGELGKTFVVPVGPVDPFSQLPDSGIQSEADLLKSGIKTLEGTISPGPDSTRYAFTKQSVHRNIYRVPTP